MKEIILASASPRRSELLRQIGLHFTVYPSNADESLDGGADPAEQVQDLAYRKARCVAEYIGKESLVIGADTVVVKDGVILGKPQCDEEAENMLRMLQGDWHYVLTGLAVIDVPGYRSIRAYEKTFVKMRSLTDREIKAYVSTGEPKDKAGAYGIQSMGAVLVERIEGCYSNVVGLPLVRLSGMLEAFGMRVL